MCLASSETVLKGTTDTQILDWHPIDPIYGYCYLGETQTEERCGKGGKESIPDCLLQTK